MDIRFRCDSKRLSKPVGSLMWTPATPRQHSRDHLRYGSDLTTSRPQLESQSVKTTESGAPRAYDAVKKTGVASAASWSTPTGERCWSGATADVQDREPFRCSKPRESPSLSSSTSPTATSIAIEVIKARRRGRFGVGDGRLEILRQSAVAIDLVDKIKRKSPRPGKSFQRLVP